MNKYMVNHQLDGKEFELVQNNNACILLTHGFTATTIEVKPIAERLFVAGYDVFAPLLPGHNTDPFDLNNKKYSDWTDYLENKLVSLFSKYDKVFVAGESMGGLLSCYLAENYSKINGLLLFAPAISVKNLYILSFLRFFKPYIGEVVDVQDDDTEEENSNYIYPWKGYKVKPTHAGFELYRLQMVVRKNLSKITQPLLIFQGLLDKTIDVKSSEIIFEKVSSTQKELIYLKNSGHCVILDKEFDFILNKSLNYLGNLSGKALI